MATIQEQILNDIDAVFNAGLSVDVLHENAPISETIKGFYDNPYSSGLVGEGDIENPTPAIFIKTSDSGNIDEGSKLTIAGVDYYPVEIETDVEGVTKITLSKDSNK